MSVPTTSVPAGQQEHYLSRKLNKLDAARAKIVSRLAGVKSARATASADWRHKVDAAQVSAQAATDGMFLQAAALKALQRDLKAAEETVQRLTRELAEAAKCMERLRGEVDCETFDLDALKESMATVEQKFIPHQTALERDLAKIDRRISLTLARYSTVPTAATA